MNLPGRDVAPVRLVRPPKMLVLCAGGTMRMWGPTLVARAMVNCTRSWSSSSGVSARVHGVGEDGDQHAEREADAVADRRRCCEGRRQPEEKVQTGDWTGKTTICFNLEMVSKDLTLQVCFS